MTPALCDRRDRCFAGCQDTCRRKECARRSWFVRGDRGLTCAPDDDTVSRDANGGHLLCTCALDQLLRREKPEEIG